MGVGVADGPEETGCGVADFVGFAVYYFEVAVLLLAEEGIVSDVRCDGLVVWFGVKNFTRR